MLGAGARPEVRSLTPARMDSPETAGVTMTLLSCYLERSSAVVVCANKSCASKPQPQPPVVVVVVGLQHHQIAGMS